MMRREFIALLGVAAAWPAAARAQQAKVHHLAIVHPSTPAAEMTPTGGNPFWQVIFEELRRLGYVEGQTLLVRRHSWPGATDYAKLADAVVQTKPDVILVVSGRLTAVFKTATTTIPIVALTNDPVTIGVAESLARPGRNITGQVTDAGIEIWEKHFELLRQIVPGASRIAFLIPRFLWEGEGIRPFMDGIRALAHSRGVVLVGGAVDAPFGEAEYARAFEDIKRQRVDGMVAFDSPENLRHRQTIVALAERMRIPAIYPYRAHAEVGGLMSYAFDLALSGRRAVGQVDQIVKGAKPADIPFQQPTKFDLVINLKAAKALGLTVPATLLARADEVIE
jgi:putative tryptophan/tyrosine transport system substrate-binding protein